jgi:hypothetical protein
MLRLRHALTIILVFALSSTTSANERWTWFNESSGGSVFYVDDLSIRDVGGFRQVWMMRSERSSSVKPRSTINLMEIDCDARRSRSLQTISYSGAKRSGKTLDIWKSEDWLYPPPNSVLDTLMERICEDAAPTWKSTWWKLSKEDDTLNYYLDEASVTRVESNFIVRTMLDLPPNPGPRSMISIEEIDCSQRRLRQLSGSSHSGPMGAGNVMRDDSSIKPWISVEKETLRDRLLQRICQAM